MANIAELMTVGTYATALEAHVARLALEQVGIQVFLEDENQPYGGGLGFPAAGAKVRVRADDVERAMETLRRSDDPA